MRGVSVVMAPSGPGEVWNLELISPDCQAHALVPLSQTAGVDTQEQGCKLDRKPDGRSFSASDDLRDAISPDKISLREE